MIRTSRVAALLLTPALVLAQGPSAIDAAKGARETVKQETLRRQAGADAAAAPEAGAAPSGRAEGSAVAADRGAGQVPAPDTYTVRPGDTLWDLSGRFLNNPWYWPKVWSFNPEITNPHWIEPGSVVKFYPSAEEAPARLEPVATAEKPTVVPPKEEEPEDLPAPRELEDFSKADMKAPVPMEDKDEVAVAGPYTIGFVPAKTMMARRDTFVTAREVDESGSITAAFEEKVWLSTWDKVYAHFRKSAELVPGETYVVYRTERPIYRPGSNELIGYQTRVLGSAKVTKVDDKAATLVIGQTLEPIERGALLGPWTEKLLRPVAQRPNGKDLEGTIVASQVDVVTEIGEHHVVFIDRGKADGVQEGNVFRVLRSGDQYALPVKTVTNDASLPDEVIGDLMVIDVKETVSTALVTRSLKELAIGDRVRMRASGGSGGN